MRVLIFVTFTFLAGLVCTHAQTAGNELFLKPEDVGAHKYVWQITPQHDEVVVFYIEEWLGDKLLRKEEQLRGTEMEGFLCTFQVLYVDGSFFDYYARGTPEGKTSYGTLQYPGGVQRLDNSQLESWRPSQINPGSVTLSFASRDHTRPTKKYVFNAYVVPYEVLKQRYPDMPPLAELRTTGWASHAKPQP